MKKIILAALTGLLPVLASAQTQKFVLDGKIQADTLSVGKIYMAWNDNGEEKRDSSIIQNNTYHFTGSIIDGAIRVNLFWRNPIKGMPESKAAFKGFAQFYAVAGKVSVVHKSNFAIVNIIGSPVQDDNNLLDQELRAKARPEIEVKTAYIESHPDSWLSYIMLENLVKAKTISLDEGDHLYASLSPALKKHRQVGGIKTLLVAGRTAVVGRQAMDFTENDVNGKPVTLSSYRGKYVLIDFWASWCHPCRAENPVVAKAFNNFKDKGFDVLGISLDGGPMGKKAWLDAIKKDGVTWTQVSNLKAFDDDIVGKYGITSIPRNFLIDPNGKIVAMDLRGPELEKKLNEILNK